MQWMKRAQRGLLWAGVAAWAAATQVAVAAAPTARDFATGMALSKPVLSPSGNRLALLVTMKNGKRAAAVMDLAPRSELRTVASFPDGDVTDVNWVNDERLVVEAFEPGMIISQGGGGVFAVDHDASRLVPLVSWRDGTASTGSNIKSRVLTYGWAYLDSIDDGGQHVRMVEYIRNALGVVIDHRFVRLNTLNGQTQVLGFGMPAGATHWQFDSRGEMRVAMVVRDGRQRLVLRKPGSEEWETLQDLPLHSPQAMTPLHLENDDALVVSTRNGGDTEGLFSYDLKKRVLDPEPLVRLARFDVGDYAFDSRTRRLVGVHVETDKPQSLWFEDRLALVQKTVDAALPKGRVNRISCARCETSPVYVVHSFSDRQPGEYLLYDFNKREMSRVGFAKPWIDENQQGRRSFHWAQSRDGNPLPLVVTHPAGSTDKQALPTVLLVHGGPWSRGANWGWEGEAQWLASRGWRVIQPDFRGSTGYGDRHFRAGWKQWGLAMQDDLADAVQWGVKEGLVDGQRVCIYGGSYGGYAALMGPARHPGLYRCAAAFAAVTDIDLMFKPWRGDLSWRVWNTGLSDMVGDPKTDAPQLRQASPIHRIADIKVPLFMAFGARDQRVPREHTNNFVSAARSAGLNVEKHEYGDEGHGWYTHESHADFLAKLEAFMAKHLKP